MNIVFEQQSPKRIVKKLAAKNMIDGIATFHLIFTKDGLHVASQAMGEFTPLGLHEAFLEVAKIYEAPAGCRND